MDTNIDLDADWLEQPVAELGEGEVKELRSLLFQTKKQEYLERLEEREIDEDWGPTSKEVEEVMEGYEDPYNSVVESRVSSKLRARIKNLSPKELEAARQELGAEIGGSEGGVTRRRFLQLASSLSAAGILAGLGYGSYKGYQSLGGAQGILGSITYLSDTITYYTGGDNRRIFLNRRFDSAADFAETVAGISYQDLSTEEQELAKALSKVWTPGSVSLGEPNLSEEASELGQELMQVEANLGMSTPYDVQIKSEEYVVEYNAAKMMALELANDFYQEGDYYPFKEASKWLVHGLIEEVDFDDLEDTSGVIDSYDMVNHYLEERFREAGISGLEEQLKGSADHRPGYELLVEIFPDIKQVD